MRMKSALLEAVLQLQILLDPHRLVKLDPDQHYTENPIYVFPERKLCGLVPNSYIHVSVSDLYIPRIGLPIWLQQKRQTNPGNT